MSKKQKAWLEGYRRGLIDATGTGPAGPQGPAGPMGWTGGLDEATKMDLQNIYDRLAPTNQDTRVQVLSVHAELRALLHALTKDRP